MVPTSVCQVLEALFKMVFGLLFAKLSMGRLYQIYLDTGMVLGNRAESETAALSMMYPVTAACAMLGVTLGALAAWVYAALYDRFRYPHRLPRRQLPGGATQELVRFALPLVVATVIQSLSGFADTASVQMCLGLCGTAQLQQIFAVPLSLTKVAEKDVVTYVYGLYSTVQDFAHLVPSLTMALGVAAVPALSGAYQDQSARFGSLYAGILKYTVILGAAGSGGLALFSYEVLSLFYGTSSPDLVLGLPTAVLVCLYCVAGSSILYLCVRFAGVGLCQTAATALFSGGGAAGGAELSFDPQWAVYLYGSAVSTAVSFLFLSVYCLVLMRGITKVKFSRTEVFAKPILAVIFTCLTVKGVAGVFFTQLQNTWNFVLSAVLFSAVLTILLLLFGTLSTKRSAFCRRKVKKTAWLLEISVVSYIISWNELIKRGVGMALDFIRKEHYNTEDLIRIVALLRAPGGCPWDQAQTHASIKKNFIEETYEVIEAINRQSTAGLQEELGDVLLQVALHAQMEAEAGRFDFNDVADGICKKLIFRHPHVFGDVKAENTDDALASWDAAKLKEKGMKKVSQSMVSIPGNCRH